LDTYIAIIVLVHVSGEQGLVEVSSTNVCLCHMQGRIFLFPCDAVRKTSLMIHVYILC